MTGAAPGGRVRRVVIRSLVVLAIGAAVLAPILYYASTVDVRPPQVDRFTLTQHLPGNQDVALTTASLEVVFSESVDHAAAQAAFGITPEVRGTFSWTGFTMVFTPADRLPLETQFTVALKAGIRDRSGNAMGAAGFAFRTVGGPTVVATQPANDAQDVALDATVQLTFSTLMDTLSVQRALQVVPRTPVSLQWSGTQLTITPTSRLQPDDTYVVVIGTEARDLAGTALSDALHLAFSTVAANLTARTIVPADQAQGIAITTPVAVVFDRAIDPGSVNDRALTLAPAVSGGVTLTRSEGAARLEDDSTRVLRFTPSGPLPPNTTFTVTLAATVRGADGARLPGPRTWSFTTGAPSSSLGNQIVFLSARSGIANLWAMNPDGSNQHEVSAELSPISTYAIAPDGRSFVVGDGVRLVQQQADGTARRVLTDQASVEFDPSYTPDGASIVFGRADAATGSGLGIWRRPAGGGSAERVAIATPSPSASPTATPSAAPPSGTGASASPAQPPPVPLLRAPVVSPDGTRLAYVGMGGEVGIVDLRDGTVARAAFAAAAPPAWIPDGQSVLLSGLPAPTGAGSSAIDGLGGILTPGTAVPPLTPAGLHLSAAQRSHLRLAELAMGGYAVTLPPYQAGATLPLVDDDGRVAYLLLDPDTAGAGRVWIASAVTLVASEIDIPAPGLESGMSFTPRPGLLVVTRVGPLVEASPTPGPGESANPTASPVPQASAIPTSPPIPGTEPGSGGIWLVNLDTSVTTQLSPDGWLARWLP